MDKKKILIQLDSDSHASVFDAVVASDSGVDRLLQYSGVQPADVRDLVHGAIFTRGPQDLQNTAIFIGGSIITGLDDSTGSLTRNASIRSSLDIGSLTVHGNIIAGSTMKYHHSGRWCAKLLVMRSTVWCRKIASA